MSETIGWIGAGRMGCRMAANVMKGGYALAIADKFSTKDAPAGSTVLASNAAAAAAGEIVVLSVPAGPDVLAVCDEIIAAPGRKAKYVVDTSTIGIQAAKQAAAKLAPHGIIYVDAPVSGGIVGAEKATLAVMAGCPKAAFERVKPILDCIGKNIFHIGEHAGQGQTVKLLNNFLSATAVAASSEAVSFGMANGLDMQTICDVVRVSSGNNTAIGDKFPNRIIKGEPVGFAAKMMAKDTRLFLENVHATGTSDRIGALVAEMFRTLDENVPGGDIADMWPMVDGMKQRKSA
jgi:3-hydroxyisobutyrate dehydrogenase